MRLDDFGDEHDEGAGRAADLEAAAAEGRDEKAADNRGKEPVLGLGARGDGDGHGERQSDDRDGQTRKRVGAKLREPVALAHRGEELGREAVVKALGEAHGRANSEAGLIRASPARGGQVRNLCGCGAAPFPTLPRLTGEG